MSFKKAQFIFTFPLSFLLLCPSTFAGNVLRVPADFPTIQAAISTSVNGDTVLVAPGTYAESINPAGKAITIRGDGADHAAIIAPPPATAAVVCNTAESTNTIIAGFTVLNCAVGFNIVNSTPITSPTILDNVIINCTIGIDAKGSSALIVGNSISKAANVGLNLGGGFFVTVRSNRIFQNNAGIALDGGEPTFDSNLVFSNATTGIAVVGNSDPVLLQNLIYGNGSYAVSWNMSPGRRGSTLVQNTIVGVPGSAIAAVKGSGADGGSIFINNIIVGTPAVDLTIASGASGLTAIRNIFYAASGMPLFGDIANAASPTNNFASEPRFLDPPSGNFQLLPDSPAIDLGTATSYSPPVDILGAPRPIDGNQDGTAIPDMGAFEFSPGPPRATSLLAYGTEAAINLSWRPFDLSTNYLIARSLNRNGPFQLLTTTTNISFVDTAVVKDVEYYYTLTGFNSFGPGAPSLPAHARAGNLPPTANADVFETLEETPIEVFPLSNDTDPNNDSLTITRLEGPIPPGLTLTATNSIRYVPPTNTFGNIVVTYVIDDGGLAFATNTVTIRVIPVNDPPVVLPQSFTVKADTNTIIRLVITDPDSTDFEIIVEQPPLHGSIVPLHNGAIDYRPDWGYSGNDSATLSLSDGFAIADPFTITLTVVPPADIDNDIMADFWENYWDLNNPLSDLDQDGASNVQEFLANTSPRDPQSSLHISRIERTAENFPSVTWPTVGGVRYRIHWTDSLQAPFQPILRTSQSEIDPGFYGVSGSETYVDSRPNPSGANRFYRISIVK